MIEVSLTYSEFTSLGLNFIEHTYYMIFEFIYWLIFS